MDKLQEYLMQSFSRIQLSNSNGPHTEFEQFIDNGMHTQFVDKFDGHVWLTSEDGQIIDPTIKVQPAYWQDLATEHECIMPPKFVHHPVRDRTLREKLWRWLWDKFAKPKIREAKQLGLSKEQLWQMFFQAPQLNQCLLNSWAHKQLVHEKLQIQIGSLGLERCDGTVWWEFG